MAKSLKIEFAMNNGATKTYKINDPKTSLSLATVTTAAEKFTATDILKIDGIKPESFKAAYYEETIRTDIVD